MEEVVGYLFNLEVRVEPTPQVGLVPDADGHAVALTAEKVEELLASGPDPDGPGVEQHPLPVEDKPALVRRPALQAKGLGPRAARPMAYSAPSESGEVKTSAQVKADDDPYAGVGRNAPCPCGSGKKYKMCHGRRA